MLTILISMTTFSVSAQQPQQFRVNVQPQFRVIVEPSAAVAVQPKTDTTAETPAAEDFATPDKLKEVINLAGTKDTEFTVVICGAKWCGPCRNYKDSSEYRRIIAKYQAEYADIDELPAWKPYAGRVPRVWIIRTSDRQRLRWFNGAATLKQVDDMIAAIRNPQPQVNNGVTMTHREMVELHNSLHGGGQWTWTGDLRTHLESVHGVRTR